MSINYGQLPPQQNASKVEYGKLPDQLQSQLPPLSPHEIQELPRASMYDLKLSASNDVPTAAEGPPASGKARSGSRPLPVPSRKVPPPRPLGGSVPPPASRRTQRGGGRMPLASSLPPTGRAPPPVHPRSNAASASASNLSPRSPPVSPRSPPISPRSPPVSRSPPTFSPPSTQPRPSSPPSTSPRSPPSTSPRSPRSTSTSTSMSIQQCAAGGDEAAVRKLLSGGVNVDDVDVNGTTSLMWASARGQLSCVKILLACNASLNIQNKKNGATALIYAARKNQWEVVDALLRAGADTSLRDKDQATALTIASRKGFTDIVVSLLSHGVSLFNTSALLVAAKKGHTDVVRALLKHGIDPTTKSIDGRSASDLAANDEIRDIIEQHVPRIVDVQPSRIPLSGGVCTVSVRGLPSGTLRVLVGRAVVDASLLETPAANDDWRTADTVVEIKAPSADCDGFRPLQIEILYSGEENCKCRRDRGVLYADTLERESFRRSERQHNVMSSPPRSPREQEEDGVVTGLEAFLGRPSSRRSIDVDRISIRGDGDAQRALHRNPSMSLEEAAIRIERAQSEWSKRKGATEEI